MKNKNSHFSPLALARAWNDIGMAQNDEIAVTTKEISQESRAGACEESKLQRSDTELLYVAPPSFQLITSRNAGETTEMKIWDS